jgi:hypothetical protein
MTRLLSTFAAGLALLPLVGAAVAAQEGNSDAVPQARERRRVAIERERAQPSRPPSPRADRAPRQEEASPSPDTPVTAGEQPAAETTPEGPAAQPAVPPESRPRDGRSVTGRAVPRPSSPPPAPVAHVHRGFVRGYPFGYGSYGLGFFYYDPWYWGTPSYYRPSAYGYRLTGELRLKVKPREAEVLVDGYYAGIVNDFDGFFQRLTLDEGPHTIELRAPGREPLKFDVRIMPGETITYRGELRGKS